MKVAAVVVSAGAGRRLGRRNKAFLDLGGRPLIFWSLKVFRQIKAVKQIVVVAAKDDLELITKTVGRDVTVVIGGSQRKDSVYNGLKALDKDIEYVLVHDVARPFVAKKTVLEILKKLKKYPGVICAVKCPDTIKKAKGYLIKKTIDREEVFLAQTPQGFKKDLLLCGYKKFKKRKITDEARVLELMGRPVAIVEPKEANFKITYPKDINLARATVKKTKPVSKFGLGFDVHKISKKKRPLTLGGVKIPCSFSLTAVSDGDVLLHAACDALCGAAGCGDIGDYFPPNDKGSKDIDSKKIAGFILGKFRKKYILSNLDVTIVAQKPRLVPYKVKISASLKKIFDCSSVNVKIKSKEGLDILGGKNAISCLVLVSATKK